MSEGSYNKALVKCPFYRDDGHTKNHIAFIKCESPFPGGLNAINYFVSNKTKEDQMTLFCCCAFKNCELYRAIMEKYDL